MYQDLINAFVHLAKYRPDIFRKELETMFQSLPVEGLQSYWTEHRGRLTTDHREKRHIMGDPHAQAQHVAQRAPPARGDFLSMISAKPVHLPPAPVALARAVAAPVSRTGIKPKPKPKIVTRSAPVALSMGAAMGPMVVQPQPQPVAQPPLLPQAPVSRAQQAKDTARMKTIHEELDKGITDPGRAWDCLLCQKRSATESECIMTIFPDGHCSKGQQPGGRHFIIPKKRTLRFKDGCTCITTPAEAEAEDDAVPGVVFYVDSVGCSRTYRHSYSVRKSVGFYDSLSEN